MAKVKEATVGSQAKGQTTGNQGPTNHMETRPEEERKEAKEKQAKEEKEAKEVKEERRKEC